MGVRLLASSGLVCFVFPLITRKPSREAESIQWPDYRYNCMMSRVAACFLLSLALLTSCGNSLNNKEKVRQAILDRLEKHSGLDLNALDVTVTSVSFSKNKAYATVAFHPKADTNIRNSMLMKYTLEARDGKWVVVNVADSQGHGMPGHGSATSDQLPPGHPALDQIDSGASPVAGSTGQQR